MATEKKRKQLSEVYNNPIIIIPYNDNGSSSSDSKSSSFSLSLEMFVKN